MLILVVGEASNPGPPSLNPFDQEDDVWQFEREDHFEEEKSIGLILRIVWVREKVVTLSLLWETIL